MKKTALALAVVTLSLCFGLRIQKALTSTTAGPEQTTMKVMAQSSAATSGSGYRRHPDSDEFFRTTTNAAGPERDNSQKIEALLKRMTLEEKVGQMTQLAIGMIAKGKDQDIQIDPEKLDKAIVRYGVGSILNVSGPGADRLTSGTTSIRPDPGSGNKEDASRHSGHLRHRFDPRRQLRAGLNAVSAGDRNGCDLESGVDETWFGNRRHGNARGRHSLELFARARYRAATAVAALLGNVR